LFVFLAVTAESVVVGEPDDCTSLAVRAPGDCLPVIDATLRRERLGSWDGGDEADIAVAELRRRASAGAVSTDWQMRWDAMIAYARRKSWLSTDGAMVRAHIVEIPA
jgi:hypothetical protein